MHSWMTFERELFQDLLNARTLEVFMSAVVKINRRKIDGMHAELLGALSRKTTEFRDRGLLNGACRDFVEMAAEKLVRTDPSSHLSPSRLSSPTVSLGYSQR